MQIYFPPLNQFTEHDIKELCDLINRVYFVTDSVLIDPKIPRTTVTDLSNMLARKELMIAEIAQKIVGCVNVKTLENTTAFFSLLVAHPDYRNQGIGKKLVHAVETWAKKEGCQDICLELLSPQTEGHEHKEFLKIWYSRLGYVQKSHIPDAIDKHLRPGRLYFSQYLIIPCDFLFFSKPVNI